MELKYIDEDNITVNGYSSNRTFMELKFFWRIFFFSVILF